MYKGIYLHIITYTYISDIVHKMHTLHIAQVHISHVLSGGELQPATGATTHVSAVVHMYAITNPFRAGSDCIARVVRVHVTPCLTVMHL